MTFLLFIVLIYLGLSSSNVIEDQKAANWSLQSHASTSTAKDSMFFWKQELISLALQLTKESSSLWNREDL